jgi:hypothetical protein
VPTSTKGGSKGLGQIKNTPKGTLVVYATKAGEVAEDNSDFINSIIKSIKEPKQSIRNLPYSISDRFTQMSTSQMPIFSAVGIPKVVLNGGGGIRSKWITPTNRVCIDNDGEIFKNGTCIAEWSVAKKICHISKGKLPSVEELKKVVIDCTGEINNGNKTKSKRNEKNSKYQSCYKDKGFTSYLYWSSTMNISNSSEAWAIYFYNGDIGKDKKFNEIGVHCLRDIY